MHTLVAVPGILVSAARNKEKTMKPTAIALLMVLAPAVLCAQVNRRPGTTAAASGSTVFFLSASNGAALRARAKMEAARDAMIAGGRMHPSDEEILRGAWAMERGVTRAQITAIAGSARGDRSFVVSFDVLAKLAASGVPAGRAAAEVQANVASGASDATLEALLTVDSSEVPSLLVHRANSARAYTPMLSTEVGGTLRRP